MAMNPLDPWAWVNSMGQNAPRKAPVAPAQAPQGEMEHLPAPDSPDPVERALAAAVRLPGQAAGVLDATATIAGQLPAMAVAGAAALPWTVLPGQSAGDVFENVLNLVPKLQPQTQQGQELLGAMSAPGGIAEKVDKPFRWVGDKAYEATGSPLAGSLAYTGANLVGPIELAAGAKALPGIVARSADEAVMGGATSKIVAARLTPAETKAYNAAKKSGKSEAEIFQETGLFEGLDGVLRKWFSDADVAPAKQATEAVRAHGMSNPDRAAGGKLGQTFTGLDPELVKRYPEFAGIKTVFTPDYAPGRAGITFGDQLSSPTMKLSKSGMADSDPSGRPGQPKGTLQSARGMSTDMLHELQHYVDKLDTGSSGTSPKAFEVPTDIAARMEAVKQAHALKTGGAAERFAEEDPLVQSYLDKSSEELMAEYEALAKAGKREQFQQYKTQFYETQARGTEAAFKAGYRSPADFGGQTPEGLFDVDRSRVWVPKKGSNSTPREAASFRGYRGEYGDPGDDTFQSRLPSLTFSEDPKVASTYALEPNTQGDQPVAPRVYAADIDIRKPIIDNRDDPFVDMSDMSRKLGRERAEYFARKHAPRIEQTDNWNEIGDGRSLDEALDEDPGILDRVYMDAYPLLNDPEFVAAAREAGYDGAIHIGNGASMDSLEYRVFDPKQARSIFSDDVAEKMPGEGLLEGLPSEIDVPGRGRVPVVPNNAIRQVAADYAKARGLDYNPTRKAAQVDPEAATQVARAFDEMKHDPENPEVKAAYGALAAETVDQLNSILGAGVKIEFIKPGMEDPYAASPRGAILDLQENNHLWVYPTDDGFGGPASAGVDISGNPLLADTGIEIDGRRLKVNDAFRIVHDVFGHAMEANGFRANGEETAARIHSDLFSPLARKALMTETRGQNSWVNFGPHAEKNRTASGATTEYAPQKTGLLPDWATERDYRAPQAGDTTLNIGMNVGEKVGLNPKKVRAALRAAGVKVKFDEVKVSNTEPTYIAKLDRPLTAAEATKLAVKLKQEAIAQRVGDEGALFGPKADAWGPFNKEFFLDPTDRKISQKARDQLGKIRSISPSHQAFIDTAMKYLTDAELERLNSKTIDKLRGFMGDMTSVDDLVNMAFAGKAKKGWYRESAEAIKTIFGDDAERFSGLLAALSPQTSVESNLENALKVWGAWNKAGRPTDDASMLSILADNVQSPPLAKRSRAQLEQMSRRLGIRFRRGTGKATLISRIDDFAAQSPENAAAAKQISILPAWTNNSLRALKSQGGLHLSGPKVQSFMRNLLGDLDEVTNDTWQAKALNVLQLHFSGQGTKVGAEKLGLKGPGYLAGNIRTRAAAEQLTKLTGEHWSPAEVQETVWSFVKALSELADESKLSLEDAWQHPDFTNARVAGIPDFGTLMRTSPKYSRILEDAGYADKLKELQIHLSDRFVGEAAEGTPRTVSGGADAGIARRLERGRQLNAKGLFE